MRNIEKVAKDYGVDITDIEMKGFLNALVDNLNLIDTLAKKEDWESLKLMQELITEIFEDTLEEIDEKTVTDLIHINSLVKDETKRGLFISHAKTRLKIRKYLKNLDGLLGAKDD